MKVKKLLSAFAALAIAASSFAGLGINANAAESTVEATLSHTASQTAGSTKRNWTYTLDQEQENIGGYTDASKAYAGYAYVQFTLPEISTGNYIKGASLDLYIHPDKNTGGRSFALYQVTSDFVIDGTAEAGSQFPNWDGSVEFGAQIGATFDFAKGASTTNFVKHTADVKDLILEAYNNKKSTITFAVAGPNNGHTGKLGGSASATNKPKLSITTTDTLFTETSVTIKKVDKNGDLLSEETVSDLYANESYTVADSYKNTFDYTVDGKKYQFVFDSSAESNKLSIDSLSATASDNVVTLVFNKTPYVTVTGNSKTTDETPIGSVSSVEILQGTENYVYPYKHYIMDNGVVYKYSGNASDYTIANVTEDTELNLVYDELANGAYFIEGEDITPQLGITTNANSSNGRYGALLKGSFTLPLSTGKYKVKVKIAEDKKRGQVLSVGDKIVSFYANGIANSATLSDGMWITDIDVAVGDTVTLYHDYTDNSAYGAGKTTTATDYFDYILVEKLPSITATLEKPSDITADIPSSTVDAKLVAVDGVAQEATDADVDLTGVQTVYIKVENVADTSVMPIVTVGGKDYAPTHKYNINSNGYFIYQFVGIDVAGATVTYTGAESVTLPAAE